MEYLLTMGLAESIGHRQGVTQHLIERQRATRQTAGQGLAFQIFHHQEVDAVLLPYVVQGTDMRMIQTGDRPRLPLEALPGLRALGHVRRQNFDRHRAVQSRVPGAVDLSHPACPDRGDDFVRS